MCAISAPEDEHRHERPPKAFFKEKEDRRRKRAADNIWSKIHPEKAF